MGVTSRLETSAPTLPDPLRGGAPGLLKAATGDQLALEYGEAEAVRVKPLPERAPGGAIPGSHALGVNAAGMGEATAREKRAALNLERGDRSVDAAAQRLPR